MSAMKKENENISWSLLAKDVSGELSPAEHLELQKELSKNPDIEKQVKKLWGDAHYAQEYETIDTTNAWLSVKGKINPERRLFTFKRVAAVAAVLVFVCVSALFYNVIVNQGQTVIHTSDSNQTVELPDGSIVVLNHNSQIKYSKTFMDDIRLVKLSGEAYFDVAENKNRPFVIETEQINVKVLGTSFNVKAYKGATNTEVVVSSGKVQVDARSNDEQVYLEAGDAVNYSSLSHTLDKHKVQTPNYKAWKTMEISFENNNLIDIIKIIEDTYHIKIEVHENVSSEQQMSGTFSQHSLEHILGTVCQAFNLKYQVKNNIYYIQPN